MLEYANYILRTIFMSNQLELKEGNFAPDFVMDTDGNGKIILSDFRGKKNVVIYFYPKDDTPGCTIEAEGFRDKINEFNRLNTVIIGISKDTVASHDEFKSKCNLPFILASDANSTVCEAYGCWVEKNMYGKKYMGIRRYTLILDKNGKIKKLWSKVKVDNHAEEVLSEVRNMN